MIQEAKKGIHTSLLCPISIMGFTSTVPILGA